MHIYHQLNEEIVQHFFVVQFVESKSGKHYQYVKLLVIRILALAIAVDVSAFVALGSFFSVQKTH